MGLKKSIKMQNNLFKIQIHSVKITRFECGVILMNVTEIQTNLSV